RLLLLIARGGGAHVLAMLAHHTEAAQEEPGAKKAKPSDGIFHGLYRNRKPTSERSSGATQRSPRARTPPRARSRGWATAGSGAKAGMTSRANKRTERADSSKERSPQANRQMK